MIKKIKFSHAYKKLLNEHNDVIDTATLINVISVELSTLPKCFVDYDTEGIFELPPKGIYLMLIFLKPQEGDFCCASNIFTTLRRLTPEKHKYYSDAIGEDFEIIIDQARS